MDEAEFDKFAEEYRCLHAANIAASGESPEFFAEYKVKDVAQLTKAAGLRVTQVLDFGAGIGNSVPHWRAYFPGASITCVDVSQKSLEIGKERFADAQFRLFDGRSLPFSEGTFDVIFAACVFHHIPHSDHLSLFREMRRVLAVGGLLVIFEHNPLNPLTVRAVNTCPFDENAKLIRGTVLRDAVLAAGFSNPTVRYRIFFPAALRAFRRLESWLTWCPLGAQYYVAGYKD